MKTLTKKQLAEQNKQEAIKELKELMESHDFTIYTDLNHASKSGMTRSISCYVRNKEGYSKNINHLIENMGTFKEDKYGGLKVTGCGMDMGFHLVYTTSVNVYCQVGIS